MNKVILLSDDNSNAEYIEHLINHIMNMNIEIFPQVCKLAITICFIHSDNKKLELYLQDKNVDFNNDIKQILTIYDLVSEILSPVTIKCYGDINDMNIMLYPPLIQTYRNTIEMAVNLERANNLICIYNKNNNETKHYDYATVLTHTSVNDMNNNTNITNITNITKQIIEKSEKFNKVKDIIKLKQLSIDERKNKQNIINNLKTQTIVNKKHFTPEYFNNWISNIDYIGSYNEEDLQKNIISLHSNIINTFYNNCEEVCKKFYPLYRTIIMEIIDKHISKEIEKGYIMYSLQTIKSSILMRADVYNIVLFIKNLSAELASGLEIDNNLLFDNTELIKKYNLEIENISMEIEDYDVQIKKID